MTPGVCSVTFRALDLAEVVDLAARAGTRAIEWGGDIHVPPGDLRAAVDAAHRTADAGLAVASYGSYLMAGACTPDDIDANVETAVTLGAPNIRIWALTGGEADVAATCARAAEHGLTVSLEFHHGTLTETAAGAQALIDAVDVPNLYTYWQPADGLTTASLLAELDAVIAHVSHLHVFRWQDHEHRWPLADGADLWPEVIDTVEHHCGRWSTDRVAFLEFVRDDDPEQFLADAAVLRGWCA